MKLLIEKNKDNSKTLKVCLNVCIHNNVTIIYVVFIFLNKLDTLLVTWIVFIHCDNPWYTKYLTPFTSLGGLLPELVMSRFVVNINYYHEYLNLLVISVGIFRIVNHIYNLKWVFIVKSSDCNLLKLWISIKLIKELKLFELYYIRVDPLT